jgi:hypothetical protein
LNGVYNFGVNTYTTALDLFNAQSTALAEANVAPTNTSDHDFIKLTAASSTIDLSGSLKLTTLGGFTLYYGQVFNLFDRGAVSTPIANFDVVNHFILADLSLLNLAWDISAFTTHCIIVVVPEPSRTLFLMLGLLGIMLRRSRR